MSSSVKIVHADKNDYSDLSLMVGELLNEIMSKINYKAFNYNHEETTQRIKDLISQNKYWIFIAKDTQSGKNIGFVSLYESFALYAEGAYATMPELYVRPKYRSQDIGNSLLHKVVEFAQDRHWHRIEVTTPPLPEFDRTLKFYQQNGFEITGGKKLKIETNA